MAAVGSTSSLGCSGGIGEETVLPERYADVLGVVALPTAASSDMALQTSDSGDDPATRLFAKVGLLVRPNASVELRIADEWSGRAALGWGGPGVPSDRFLVEPCPPRGTTTSVGSVDTVDTDRWIAHAGGFWVAEPGCISVVVESAGEAETIEVGVGAPCPGQQGPPEPSDP